MQNIIQDAKIEKYLNDRDIISKEGIGFFSGFTRKGDLQIERLNNVNLKIQLAQSIVPEEQKDYNIRNILADLHTCATVELGGNFTPKMQELYNTMKNAYERQSGEEFTEEAIRKLARDKIMASQNNLPVIQEPKRGFFGRRKNQIELLRLENKGLEVQIAEMKTRENVESSIVRKPDAIQILDSKLDGIVFATENKIEK